MAALAGLALLAACANERVEGRWSLAELELVPGCTLEVEIPREAQPERLDLKVEESGAVVATHERDGVVRDCPADSFDAWKRTYPELVALLDECAVEYRFEASWED
jgi:hypothetical protein